MARHRFRGFGAGDEHASIAGPLIGGGATQVGIMLAHLHARKNPTALRHAGVHGAVLGVIVGGALAMSSKYRQTGYSALATVAIMTIPRMLEGFMGLGHREETAAMHGLGIITPQALQGAGEEQPVVQLLDSNEMNGGFGVHVAEELNGAGNAASEYVEMMGTSGFGSTFLQG